MPLGMWIKGAAGERRVDHVNVPQGDGIVYM